VLNSITHAAIEPRDEWSLVRAFACSKEPEPVGGSQIKTERKLKMEHKPDALIRRYITISGSLINTRRSFCQKCEYDRMHSTAKQNDPTTYARILHYTKVSRCPWSLSIARDGPCQFLKAMNIAATWNDRELTAADECGHCGESKHRKECRTQKHLDRAMKEGPIESI